MAAETDSVLVCMCVTPLPALPGLRLAFAMTVRLAFFAPALSGRLRLLWRPRDLPQRPRPRLRLLVACSA
eukprot:15458581-Alexandrium_andersonii.AAC.1